jgi:head-tail adaptor
MTKRIELQLGEVFEIKVGNHITTWKMVTQSKAVRQPNIDWERIESDVEKLCLEKMEK